MTPILRTSATVANAPESKHPSQGPESLGEPKPTRETVADYLLILYGKASNQVLGWPPLPTIPTGRAGCPGNHATGREGLEEGTNETMNFPPRELIEFRPIPRVIQSNAHKALHGFHIPEPEKPLIVEEPEPEPVAIAPKVETGLQTFNFGSLPVRVVMREGEPWWMAADVCAVLDIQNPTDALTRLDEDEKGTLDSTEGGPGRRIVSESGLYSLVLGSRKPEALRYALSRQRDRRNLTDADLVRLVGELDKRKHREDNLKRGVEIPEAPCGVSEEPARSSSKTAKILGISERKVEDSTLEQNQAPNVTPFLRPWRGPRGDGGAA